MTTHVQGKGKKKNKESTKLSLDESNHFDASVGHSVISSKMNGLDRASKMANHDQQATETQQIITSRAQRGPGVDFGSLPSEGPFRVSMFGLPMSVEGKDIIERFFFGLDVVRVDITKSSTIVELSTKQDLYDALCKDGTSLKGRTINVCLLGQTPQSNSYGSDRSGGRGCNSSYVDRYGDRGQGGGFGGPRGGDKYGDRDRGSGGFGRERDSYSGFNRGGFAHQRGGGGGGLGDNQSTTLHNRSLPSSSSLTASPSASSYYAGAKFLSPPIPSLLPMPPKSWLSSR